MKATKKQKPTKPASKLQTGEARKAKKSAPADAAPKVGAPRERDPRIPAPGTTLTRVYKGREHRLKVLADGFEYEGETFRSLTAAAKKATGYPSIAGTDWWGVSKRAPAAPKAAKGRKAAEPTDVATEPASAAESAAS
jgi:hypothetical protein